MTNTILDQKQSINTSQKYQVITSQDVVNKFVAEGWTISKVLTSRVKKAERRGFQNHIVRMRHPSLAALSDGLFPEIVLKNSYDGTSALKLMLGIYRLVCSNGLVAGTSVNSINIKHVGPVWDHIGTGVGRLVAAAPNLGEQVTAMKAVTLTDNQVIGFGVAAAEEVLDIDMGESFRVAQSLTARRRHADSGNDVFTIFNRVQEAAINGYYNKLDSKGLHRSARRITSISKNIEVNQKLWNMAMAKVG